MTRYRGLTGPRLGEGDHLFCGCALDYIILKLYKAKFAPKFQSYFNLVIFANILICVYQNFYQLLFPYCDQTHGIHYEGRICFGSWFEGSVYHESKAWRSKRPLQCLEQGTVTPRVFVGQEAGDRDQKHVWVTALKASPQGSIPLPRLHFLRNLQPSKTLVVQAGC